jgi:hypothetical protein
MKSTRRGGRYRPPRMNPRFVSDPEKQRIRDETAAIIGQHFGDWPIKVFVLPFYFALCANAIHGVAPNASFYGTDRNFLIAENVAEVAGKQIEMERLSVSDYVRQTSRKFDVAWLDYFGKVEDQYDDIIAFAGKLLKPYAVFAVTGQGLHVEQHIEVLMGRLRPLASSVKLLKSDAYTTSHAMIHLIFLLEHETVAV